MTVEKQLDLYFANTAFANTAFTDIAFTDTTSIAKLKTSLLPPSEIIHLALQEYLQQYLWVEPTAHFRRTYFEGRVG